MSEIAETVKRLRKDIDRSKPVADGTIIGFVWKPNMGGWLRQYKYTAIYVSAQRRWYTTAMDQSNTAPIQPVMTHQALMQALGRNDISDVAVATEFEAVS